MKNYLILFLVFIAFSCGSGTDVVNDDRTEKQKYEEVLEKIQGRYQVESGIVKFQLRSGNKAVLQVENNPPIRINVISTIIDENGILWNIKDMYGKEATLRLKTFDFKEFEFISVLEDRNFNIKVVLTPVI